MDVIPQPTYPSLSARVQSSFIDLLLLIALMGAASAVFDSFKGVPDWLRAAVFVSIWVLYEPVATASGATLGNYIKGLRVRQFKNPNCRINFFQALLRYVLKVALGWLSFVTIHSNPERRAIHDFAAGSVMIVK